MPEPPGLQAVVLEPLDQLFLGLVLPTEKLHQKPVARLPYAEEGGVEAV